MSEDKLTRTYVLRESVVHWVDNNYENMPTEKKSALVERAVQVYAAKVNSGEWSDPKFEDDDESDSSGFILSR